MKKTYDKIRCISLKFKSEKSAKKSALNWPMRLEIVWFWNEVRVKVTYVLQP